MIPIVPALIPKSRDEVAAFAEQFSFVSEVHVDMVDGMFVPFTSWPQGTFEEPRDIKFILDTFSLEVDLMVQNPVAIAGQWIVAGADSLVFHVETISLDAFRAFVGSTSLSVGICANNDTPLSELLPYLAVADYVQVMGIAKIGAQGQPFDTRCFDRIADIKKHAPQLSITLDGSVNEDTLVTISRHPIDRCIVGSALTKAENPQQKYQLLRGLLLQQ